MVRTFESQPDRHSFSLSFSPDGTLLADSGSDGRITLWDTASGKSVRTLSHGKQNDVHDIQFSPDGKLLVSVGTDYAVRLWDVSSGQVLQTMMHGNGLYGVAFSPDGRLVASAGCDRTVKIWEAATGKLVKSLRHGDEVTSVAFSHRTYWECPCEKIDETRGNGAGFGAAGRIPRVDRRPGIEIVEGDVLDTESLYSSMHQVKGVFHWRE